QYVRGRTMVLAARNQKQAAAAPFLRLKPSPVLGAQSADLLAGEIASLPPSAVLVRHGEFVVFAAEAVQISRVLEEIGRLREITFRSVGEGTGRSLDTDAFDRHYQHLFVWNSAVREIVGAYRFAKTDEVISSRGVRGLYTNRLFRLTPAFYR